MSEVPSGGVRLRVAFVIDTIECDTAGTQKQLLEIIRRLDAQNFEPYLICLRDSEWLRQNLLPCPYVALRYERFVNRKRGPRAA